MKALTCERAREAFAYDPATGELSWRIHAGAKTPGNPAGTLAGNGYVNVRIDGEMHLAHRVIWLMVHGHWPKHEIDHINRVKSDNRLQNLRDVSRSVNHQNRGRARAGSLTGELGVRFNKRRGCYFSEITVDGKPIYLGSFASADMAKEAYLTAKRRLHEGCAI